MELVTTKGDFWCVSVDGHHHHIISGGELSFTVLKIKKETSELFGRRKINKWEYGWKKVEEEKLDALEKTALHIFNSQRI